MSGCPRLAAVTAVLESVRSNSTNDKRAADIWEASDSTGGVAQGHGNRATWDSRLVHVFWPFFLASFTLISLVLQVGRGEDGSVLSISWATWTEDEQGKSAFVTIYHRGDLGSLQTSLWS